MTCDMGTKSLVWPACRVDVDVPADMLQRMARRVGNLCISVRGNRTGQFGVNARRPVGAV
jgi:hypothetical protein